MPILSSARNLAINNGYFVDISQNHNHYHGNALQILLSGSLPEAVHDSSARHPPPRCLPGTRRKYIDSIVSWVRTCEQQAHIMWLSGPPGVGKSAVAQTCAEELEERLAATFFFSRCDKRDDPTRLVPTIAYQLAARIPSYATLVEGNILRDPTLVSKTMRTQFRELLVIPFQALQREGTYDGNQRLIVIVDGLDESNDEDAQCEFIHLVATSIQERTLPFLWAIFGRPETALMSIFSSPEIGSLCWKVALSMSQDANDDIELYLKHGLRGQTLSSEWPTETHISLLVKKSAGLFVYASTILKFLGDPDLHNPEQQLEELLFLRPPLGFLSDLDTIYTTIMKRIPSETLPITLTVLLVVLESSHAQRTPTITEISNLLGISARGMTAALSKLRSVLVFEETSSFYASRPADDLMVRYYHTSFLDFLRQPKRSGGFCLYQPRHFALWAKRCFQVIREAGSGGVSLTNWNEAARLEVGKEDLKNVVYHQAAHNFLPVCTSAGLAEFPELIEELRNCDYKMMAETIGVKFWEDHLFGLLDQVQKQMGWRSRLIRPCNLPLFLLHKSILKIRRKFDKQTTQHLITYFRIGIGERSALLFPGYQLSGDGSKLRVWYCLGAPETAHGLLAFLKTSCYILKWPADLSQ